MKRVAACLAIVTAAALAGCGTQSGESGDADHGEGVTVVTGAYPLAYAISRVGGDHVDVENLTSPGAEPHDLELTPRQVAEVESATVVVYLAGFQPALDEAVTNNADPATVLDVGPAANLIGAGSHAGHEADDGHEHHDHPDGSDPHFWLDPTRLADAGDAIADKLAAQDPQHAADYRANAQALRTDLEALDERYSTGLATCASRNLVTGHEAFGYLADRYDLRQIAIAGLTPADEPSPRALAGLVSQVRSTGATTVYTEPLVSPAVAETVAGEAGVRTAVLDPLEGLAADTSGSDYLTVMDTNLATLRTGQDCA